KMEDFDQALIYMNAGKYEEAAKEFIEYINANETDPIGYLNFGNLLVLLEQYEEAERIFRKAIDLDSELATLSYSLGFLFYVHEKYRSAQTQSQVSILFRLDDIAVILFRCIFLWLVDHYTVPFPYLLQATELAPDEFDTKFQYC